MSIILELSVAVSDTLQIITTVVAWRCWCVITERGFKLQNTRGRSSVWFTGNNTSLARCVNAVFASCLGRTPVLMSAMVF